MVKNQRLRKKSIFVGNFVSFRFVALLPKREQKIQQGACFSFGKDLGLSPSFFCKSEKKRKKELICCKHLFLPSAAILFGVANCFDIA